MSETTRLPGPVADLWDWQLQGSCRRVGPDVFFHPEGERGPAREARERAAKAVCATCPVIEQCREHALAVREPYGVWGGLSEDDRERIYARIAITEYPRARGEGAAMCAHDIAGAISANAMGIA